MLTKLIPLSQGLMHVQLTALESVDQGESLLTLGLPAAGRMKEHVAGGSLHGHALLVQQ